MTTTTSTLPSLPITRGTAQEPVPALQKILVPIDFSPASKKACRYAVRFADKFGAKLTLLYVMTPVPALSVGGISVAGFGSSDRASAEEHLRALVKAERNGSADQTECVLREGVPSHDIVEFAKEAGTDLIVMSTHGYTGWKHFCIGSTAERVVRAAPCPVLVVREKEHDFV